MGKKISDLNPLTNVSGDNKILIMSGGDTMYATVGNINSFIQATEDMEAIRSGAQKGATALQSVPSEYITETELNAKSYATESYVNTKFDEVFLSVSNGKVLIASAITDKGVYASNDETFQELSDKIDSIKVAPPGTNIIGYVDEQNDIYVSLSDIENGTYDLKYENNDGLLTNFHDIGTLEVN